MAFTLRPRSLTRAIWSLAKRNSSFPGAPPSEEHVRERTYSGQGTETTWALAEARAVLADRGTRGANDPYYVAHRRQKTSGHIEARRFAWCFRSAGRRQ